MEVSSTSENGLCNGACKKASLSQYAGNSVLQWSNVQESSAPHTMDFGSCTASGNTAYFKHEVHNAIYTYKASSSQWSELPQISIEGFTLVVINDLLTAVGGYNTDEVETNTLLSLTSQDGERDWSSHYPPMPSKRCFPTAVCTKKMLIVAGGLAGDDEPVDTVELMDLETRQWYAASSLPYLLCSASGVVCGDRLYLVGGFDGNESRQTVFTCSLNELYESVKHSQQNGVAKEPTVWQRVADTPVSHSTAVGINGKLVAFGGKTASGETTGEVYVYDPDADSWSMFSQMPAPRSQCLVATLDGSTVMVVGGWMDYKLTDTVEFATF